ncbi:MAG TPA: acetyl-CoA carboxylase, carboxyltransferase subunit beta [Kiritimatiellia bacterium]|nr:acetyl-CoA carboxylase, carboxyltransferase subunit beta [Kiritimatiellia bacterium]
MALFSKKNYSTIKVKKRELPDGLWQKCPGCGEILFKQELQANHMVCPKCGHHFQLSRKERIDLLMDEKTFEPFAEDLVSVDVLEFTGTASYTSKLQENEKKTGYHDAITIGLGKMGGIPVGFGVMDFSFLGASMGSVVGEKVTLLIEMCTKKGLPAILCCASGGARMYEGLFSLMQMAKTSGALARHTEAGLLYIPVLTHPTTAGVMASFATLGDLIVAEPGALIGFAGPRVIKETTQQDLPEGFQRSEFLLDHGLLDLVVKRHDLKSTLVDVLTYTKPKEMKAAKA